MKLTEHGGYKAGDLVKIVTAGANDNPEHTRFFAKGHMCRLIHYDTELSRWKANFNNKGNGFVTAPGVWYVGNDARDGGDEDIVHPSKIALVERRKR